ncbi:RICIN domain-containing protein [Stigmatella hybrida]|uniref:RICIN domain-containing protein n=1 Tax=Stigmatella hybrida TaxID=394097 RepID=UPI001CDA9978|nr:RICIN domain-containing protein [Stigmatella hybrida]
MGWQQDATQQWRFYFLGQPSLRNDIYAIFNQASGQAMDVAGCSAANGAKIEQFPWWGGDCQRFQVTANGDGSFRITVRTARAGPSMCPDAPRSRRTDSAVRLAEQ